MADRFIVSVHSPYCCPFEDVQHVTVSTLEDAKAVAQFVRALLIDEKLAGGDGQLAFDFAVRISIEGYDFLMAGEPVPELSR